MNQSIFDLIAFTLSKIQNENDWRPFDDLILNHSCHPAQYTWLTKSVYKENLLHPGNGWGKTDVIAKKHLKFILKHFMDGEKYKTLNVSITTDQSELVQDRIISLIKNSPTLSWLINARSITKFPFPKITYVNGATSEFKTTKRKGESIEGKEYGYISADDIALENHLEFLRDLILMPRLRKYNDSQLDFLATPKGKNAYWRIATDIARKGGCVLGGTSFENPHIDHELLNYQMSTWSENRINQVIRGEFIDNTDMMFASRIALLINENLSLTDDVDKDKKYLEAWDLARGRKGKTVDQTVGFRFDISEPIARLVKKWNFQLPWTDKGASTQEKMTGEKSLSTETMIRNAHIESDSISYMDSTGVGDTLWEILMDFARPVDFRGGNKDRLLDHAQAVIDAGLIQAPYIPELVDEMTVYQRNDGALSTDYLMAFVIACSHIPLGGANFGTVEG